MIQAEYLRAELDKEQQKRKQWEKQYVELKARLKNLLMDLPEVQVWNWSGILPWVPGNVKLTGYSITQ